MTVLEADITAAARRIAGIRSVSDLDALSVPQDRPASNSATEPSSPAQRPYGGLGEAVRETPEPIEETP